ncbi:acyltransferase [Clostridium oryzae]|uniref:acyltransferase n=1 Tax=Clostridium oryzae TaxID=1450648 RepID=UPI0011164D9E|nr:acyltransferase [Clostridium oryzae]
MNLKLFDIKTALKLPVFCTYNSQILHPRKGSVLFPSGVVKHGSMRIGFSDGSFQKGRGIPTYVNFNEAGVINVTDTAIIPAASIVNVAGILNLGSNFESNSGLLISCEKEITIGGNTAIGWDVTIIDGDGHDIISCKNKINGAEEVIIGDHVWICSRTTILKGTIISKDSVVGYGAIVSGSFGKEVIIGGIPGKVIKENITWRR